MIAVCWRTRFPSSLTVDAILQRFVLYARDTPAPWKVCQSVVTGRDLLVCLGTRC